MTWRMILSRRVANVVGEAEAATKPLELDPYRGQLFELFVMADAAGFVAEDAEIDLTADNLCRELAALWGLTEVTQDAMAAQSKIPPRTAGKTASTLVRIAALDGMGLRLETLGRVSSPSGQLSTRTISHRVPASRHPCCGWPVRW